MIMIFHLTVVSIRLYDERDDVQFFSLDEWKGLPFVLNHDG